MKKSKPIASESGITLVALLIMIILLVIISAVVIQTLTGNESLVKKTETAGENYTITQYKEQIYQKVNDIVLKHATNGEEITMEEIAEELKETWIKKSETPGNLEENNEDIMVTVVSGYTYQVYYNSTYGVIYVEYVGEEKGGEFPSIKTDYVGSTIKTKTKNSKQTELSYKGELKDTKTGTEITFNTSGTGWYIIRTTSNEGKLRYAWIKTSNITDKIPMPTIAVTPNTPKGKNKWYNEEVTVTITAPLKAGQKITYDISGAMKETDIPEGKPNTFGITKTGYTRITARVEEGEKQSKEISEVIKYDKTAPEITEIELKTIEGTKVEEGTGTDNTKQYGWLTQNGELTIKAEDQGSGVEEYKYEILTIEGKIIKNTTTIPNIDTPIKIETDGKYIIKLTVIDKAGNESIAQTIEIHKDCEKPTVEIPTINGEIIGGVGFEITISAGDEISGIGKYEYYINGELKGETEGIGKYKVTGLKAGKGYNVQVRVYDKAGNYRDSISIPATTTGDLQAPNIILEGTEGQTGYYRSDVKITIADKVALEETRAVKMLIVQNGKETEIDGRTYTYTVKDEGEYELKAYMVDNKGNKSEVSDIKSFWVDKTDPSTASIKATTIGYTNIETEGAGKDDLSGIYSYEFQKSLTGRDDDFQTVKTQISTRGTEKCSYSSLLQGRTYYFRIKVTDRAGNYKYGTMSAVTKIEVPEINIEDKEAWTKTGKKVTMGTKNGYTTKYTINGDNPNATVGETYTGEITLRDNCTIKAAYISSENIVGEIGTNTITRIDKLAPTTLNISLTAGKTTVTVNVVTADDAAATSTDGKSNISGYRFSKDGGKNWTAYQEKSIYVFNNVCGDLNGEKCTVVVEAKDGAENIIVTSKTITTGCKNTSRYYTGNRVLRIFK